MKKKTKKRSQVKIQRDQKSQEKRKNTDKNTLSKISDLGPIPKREISPATNLSVKEYLNLVIPNNPKIHEVVKNIRT